MEQLLFDFGLPKEGFVSEKEEVQYIKNIERIFRASKEYKQFVSFIRQEFDGEYCKITGEHCSVVDVELHHYPLSLYEICMIATYTLLNDKKDSHITTFDVAKLVCEMHFKLHVGIVPIVKTLHEKIHATGLMLPAEWVIGNPWHLLSTDCEYVIPEEHLLWKLERASKFTLEDWNNQCKPILWPETTIPTD